MTLGLVDKSSAPSPDKYLWESTGEEWEKKRLWEPKLEQVGHPERVVGLLPWPLGDFPLEE